MAVVASRGPLGGVEEVGLELDGEDLARVLQRFPSAQEIWALSPMQRTMFIHGLVEHDPGLYCEHLYWRAAGRLDVEQLHRAFSRVLEQVPSLRAAFSHGVSSEPVQVICPEAAVPVEELWVKEAELETTLSELVRVDRARGFDLSQPPLMRVTVLRLTPESSLIVLCHHHLLFDGWSVALLLQAVLEAYGTGQVSLSESGGYRDFIRWLANQDRQGLADHWTTLLRDAETPSALHCMERSDGAPFEHAQVDFEWDERFVSQLKSTAQTLRVTPSSLILGAWALVLGRQSGADEVTFGLTSSGRPESLPSSAEAIGLFIATVPLRVALGEKSLQELFQEVHHQAVVAREFEHVSQAELARWSRTEARDFDPFHSLVVFENYPGDRVLSTPDGALTFEAPEFTEQTNTPCALYVLPGETWKLRVTFDGSRLSEEVILSVVEQVRTCLSATQRNSAERLSKVSLQSPAEQQLWAAFNATKVNYGDSPSLVSLLETQARARKDEVAVVDGERALSYGVLRHRARAFAAGLIERGVTPKDRVALYTDRRLEMLVGIYGILLAGAAYVPIEKKIPEAQTKSLLSVAMPRCIAVSGDVPDWLLNAGDCVEIEASETTRAIDLPVPAPADVAYVIFTSGSTGEPKGVEVSHSAVYNYACSVPEMYGWRASDRVLQFCSVAFDAAAEEIFGALACGGRLVLRPDDMLASYGRFNEVIRELDINVVSLPTAVWHAWVESLGGEERKIWDQLRVVIIGGERARPASVARWHEICRNRARLFNTYGPSETTIVSLMSELDESSHQSYGEVPIGRPVPNTQAFVLDKHLRFAPRGVPGELYIGGTGLACGYLNSPEQTAARFAKFLGEDGPVLYRTGDLVRMRSDGKLEFCGRVDDQVKVRGYRVEPGAIETVAQRHSEVREVVVTAIERAGQTTLVGYFSAASESSQPLERLREYMKKELPEYMNPSVWVQLDRLPLTVRGKVDRAALPEPVFESSYSEKPLTRPISPLQEKIAAIWCELLEVAEVGIDQEFFDVGGHSLLALKLLSRLQSELKLEITLQGFFAGPTIEKLASLEQSAYNVEKRMQEDALTTFNWTAPPAEPPYQFAQVLLTGATGFLGTFLLGELLSTTDATVWCLVRAESKEAALKRIASALSEAGLWEDEYRSRLLMLCGDLGAARFGLTEQSYRELSETIDTVVHNGAKVNFAEPYEALRRANVVGTRNVIEFAGAVRAKGIHYVSTLGIFDTGPGGATSYAECWIDEVVRPLPSGYGQTKWVAERLMTRARDGGLPVSIYRPGRVSGHSKTAAWSDDDLVCQMIAACSAVGAAPSLDMTVDLTPVDYVAKAIVSGAKNREFGRVLHLVNPNPSSLDRIVPMLSTSLGRIDSVDLVEWTRRVEKAALQDPDHPWLQLTALLPQWKEMLEPPADGGRRFECRQTVDHLETRGIHCPPVDDKLVQTYVSSLQRRGVVRTSQGAI